MRGFLIALFVLGAAGAAAAAEFSTLEEKMSTQEYRAAGLEKLSPEELATLNAWLQRRVAAGLGSAGARPTDEGFRASGFAGDGGDRKEITSRITGEFSGWGPNSVFQLDNGQQWQVTDNSDFAIPAISNPAVRIEPMMLGSWRLKVEGYNRGARVTRIR